MEWSVITPVLEHAINALPSFLVVILVLVASRYLFLVTTRFGGDGEIVGNRNAATGLVFGAYLLGVAIALQGSFFEGGKAELSGANEGLLIRMGKLMVEGALIVLLLRLSIWVNDRFILSRFRVAKEVKEDRNLGAAFCLAGSSLAGGLILNGALSGYSFNFLFGLRDIILFWILGQVVLIGGSLLYQRVTRYDVHRLIEYDDNAAVGVGFGGFLVGLGIIVRSALVGAGGGSLGTELLQTAILAVLGVGGLMAVRSGAAYLLMPKANYEEDVEMSGNMAVSIVAAMVLIGVAILLGAAIQRGIS